MRIVYSWRRVLGGGLAVAGLVAVGAATAPSASAGGTIVRGTVWTTGSGGQTLAQSVDGGGNVVASGTTSALPTDAIVVGSGPHDYGAPAAASAGSVSFNPTTGEVRPIEFSAAGVSSGPYALAWTCPAAGGCSAEWTPIGYDDVNGDGTRDVLWYDASQNRLGAWLTNGRLTTTSSGTYLAVTGTLDLTTSCSFVACGSDHAVGSGDLTGDGKVDVLTYDSDGGALDIWVTNGQGGFTTELPVSWTCDSACAVDWKLVGVADANGDGRLDIVWYDPWTGVVAAWLLDGAGGVTGTLVLHTETPAQAHIAGVSTTRTDVS